jgi:phage baseplate assembly protein gpV
MPKVISPLLFANDNSYSIGAAGASRPNAVYVGGFVAAGLSPYTLTLGSSSGGVYITPSATDVMQFGTAGTPRFNITASGHLLAATDNTYDIGAAGATRPRTVYAATSFIGPGAVPTGGTAGQVLSKVDATNYNLVWVTPASGGGGITLPLGQHLTFSPDNTYDIGASGASRPRYVIVGSETVSPRIQLASSQPATNPEVYFTGSSNTGIYSPAANQVGISSAGTSKLLVTSTLMTVSNDMTVTGVTTLNGRTDIGSPVNGQIYSVAGSVPGIAVASTSASGGAQLAATATAQVTSNALWNGSSWTRITTGAASTLQMLPGALSFYTAPSAAAAVPPAFATVMSVDVSGNLSVSGNMTSTAGNLSVSGNITSTGGNLSIAGGGNFSAYTTFFTPSSAGVADPGSSLGAIQIQPNSGGGASMICFHRPGSYATYFGLDTDNIFRVGGWSAGAVAYRLTLGDGYNNPSLSLGGTNVGTNGVLLSVHANYYGGVYYSTTGSFVTWSQTDHKRNIQPLQTRQLWNRERRTIKYQQMDIDWDDKHPGNYIWHEPKADKPYSYGFDVDEWAADFPELVVDAPGGIKGMNYVGMIPILWEAVRDLRAEIQLLKEKR